MNVHLPSSFTDINFKKEMNPSEAKKTIFNICSFAGGVTWDLMTDSLRFILDDTIDLISWHLNKVEQNLCTVIDWKPVHISWCILNHDFFPGGQLSHLRFSLFFVCRKLLQAAKLFTFKDLSIYPGQDTWYSLSAARKGPEVLSK